MKKNSRRSNASMNKHDDSRRAREDPDSTKSWSANAPPRTLMEDGASSAIHDAGYKMIRGPCMGGQISARRANIPQLPRHDHLAENNRIRPTFRLASEVPAHG